MVPGLNPQLPGRATVRAFDNKELPAASFYSQAVCCGPLVFLAGHIPVETTKPGKPVVRGFDDIPEAGRFLATGRSHPDSRQGADHRPDVVLLRQDPRDLAARASMPDMVHVNIFLQDVRDFGTFHRVHRHFFPEGGPALVVTGFNEVGHRSIQIEIEPTALEPGSAFASRSVGWPIKAPFAGPAAVKTGNLVLLRRDARPQTGWYAGAERAGPGGSGRPSRGRRPRALRDNTRPWRRNAGRPGRC